MAWFNYRPYVPVAARRAAAALAAASLAKRGRKLDPVVIEGRKIASTFWGDAWCRNLEAYSDYENRLPRGRAYARNGFVIDLQIAQGEIRALVQGSSLYEVTVRITPLPPARWRKFLKSASSETVNMPGLLLGRLPAGLLAAVTSKKEGLFPSPKEISLSCSCPDWADMCKHVAAVLYGVGARLDTRPGLFFTLRGVDPAELVTAASESVLAASAPSDPALAGADLSALFGVEIEDAAPVSRDRKAPAKRPSAARTRKTSKSSTLSKPSKSSRSSGSPARTAAAAKKQPPAKTAKPASRAAKFQKALEALKALKVSQSQKPAFSAAQRKPAKKSRPVKAARPRAAERKKPAA